jgi:formate hydrogenlyase subunit 6/NADH:ubiquinone oxidoreductase subunit I
MTSSEKIMPIIDLAKCNGCGACVERCPTGALALRDERVFMAWPDLCSYCATCEDTCPTGAIALPYQIVLAPEARAAK